MNRTKYGLAIRASAANADAARLSGINIKRMSTLVWVRRRRARGHRRDAVRSPQPGRCVGARCRTRHAAARPRGRAHRRHGLDAARARRAVSRSASPRASSSTTTTAARAARPACSSCVVLVTLLVSGRRRGLAEADAGRWSFAPRIRPIPAALQAKWWVRSLPAFGVGFVALVALFPLVFLDLPSQREAWSRVLLYALVALVAHGAHRLGRPAVARAVRVRGCRRA